MIKKLKVDHDFTPCSVTTGDEIFPNGFFEFNITKIIEHIQNNPDSINLEEVEVNDFYKEFSSTKESHIDSVKISRPVILADDLFHKFMEQVESIFKNLYKPLKWQSFLMNCLILLIDIPLKVQTASVKQCLNKAKI